MYTVDADDKLPDAARWIDLSAPYTKNPEVLNCPTVKRSGGEYGYAFNLAASNKKPTAFPDPHKVILLFETKNLVRNASGDPKLEPYTNRHTRGRSESYLDGSAKSIRTPRE
jgi:hypothetical protein